MQLKLVALVVLAMLLVQHRHPGEGSAVRTDCNVSVDAYYSIPKYAKSVTINYSASSSATGNGGAGASSCNYYATLCDANNNVLKTLVSSSSFTASISPTADISDYIGQDLRVHVGGNVYTYKWVGSGYTAYASSSLSISVSATT